MRSAAILVACLPPPPRYSRSPAPNPPPSRLIPPPLTRSSSSSSTSRQTRVPDTGPPMRRLRPESAARSWPSRAGFFQNMPLTKTLALRYGAGFLDSHGKAKYDFRRENYYGLSAMWKIGDRQQLIVDTENVDRTNYNRSSRGYAMTNSHFLYN